MGHFYFIANNTDGQPIPFDDFQDLLGLLCEDISGLESLPEEQFVGLVSQLWSLYRALTSDYVRGRFPLESIPLLRRSGGIPYMGCPFIPKPFS